MEPKKNPKADLEKRHRYKLVWLLPFGRLRLYTDVRKGTFRWRFKLSQLEEEIENTFREEKPPPPPPPPPDEIVIVEDEEEIETK